MLRNIPNKIDQVTSPDKELLAKLTPPKAMLKEIIDETSHGKYDFMYLRIGRQIFQRVHWQLLTDLLKDFANNCK